MSRWVVVAAIVLGPALNSGCAGPEERAPADNRPNIVFILLDDVRVDDLYDSPLMQLPTVERLAAEGARFENFFTVAPLCSPSRAAFLTGQYPFRNGIVDNRERAAESHELVTFPRLLQEAGYQSAFVGKWHMGHEDASPRPGFDHWVSFVGQGTYFDPEMNINGERALESGYMTDVLSRYAEEFVRGADQDRPFVLFLAHKAVHPEIHANRVRSFPAAPEDQETLEDGELPRTESWRADLDGKPALARVTDYDDPRSPLGGTPDDVIRGRLRMLQSVDRGLARLLGALEDTGRLDETVLVLTSDQGFFYGEFGLAQERRLAYEPSIRIPLIVRYPPLAEPGSRISALTASIDIAPTLLELGSLLPPPDTDGTSLVPVLSGAQPEVRGSFLIEYYSDEVFARIVRMGYKALRTDQYKYIRYDELEGMDELYDLRADPDELVNTLSGSPVELIEQLDAALAEHLAR